MGWKTMKNNQILNDVIENNNFNYIKGLKTIKERESK